MTADPFRAWARRHARARADRLRPWIMGGAALVIAACVAAQALAAQVAPFGPRMVALPGDGDCLARVEIHNLLGTYNATETLDTAAGVVSVRYQTIGGHKPGDDDTIEVVSLPDGVFARPMQASIRDGDVLVVCLFEYVGG
jgi:hypothetical protein